MKTLVFYMLIPLVGGLQGRNFNNAELNEFSEEKLLNAICQSFHKQTRQVSSMCYIQDTCNMDLQLKDFKQENKATLKLPRLICKENNMANFFWNLEYDFAYFLAAVEKDHKILSDVTMCNFTTLKNLTEDRVYRVRLWGASFSKKLILHSDILQIRTSGKYSVPSPVTDISLENLILKENSYDALIKWRPNKDNSCHYTLVWLKEDSIYEEEANVVSDLLQARLKDLNFGLNYTVEIFARSQYSPYESPKKSFSFITPSCLESYHTLDKCRPEPPSNLIINERIISERTVSTLYNIYLNWSKPALTPNYYIAHFISINPHDQNKTEKFLNITGNLTTAVFEKLQLGSLYHVSLMACSKVGCSEKIAEERHQTDIHVANIPSYPQWKILVLIIIALLIVTLAVTITINYYRLKQKRREERERYFKALDEQKLPQTVENLEINLIKEDIFDQWELDRNKLFFQSVIGEGAFGIVRRAYLEMKDGTKVQVAVKMLKESPTSEEIRQFTQEINIMKSVRQHPYIVSLIGCVTEGRVEGPLLVVEYCSRGDLQTYLRNAWDKFVNMQQQIDFIDESSYNSSNYFANRTYDIHNVNLEDDFIIQPKHLISIARQVALGMEHLAKTRLVHRDLAARNVLVCENHTVKVSDFGLSRDVYQDNVYCKSTGGKLPVRWMALESLTHQRYTTHSDVWSFGILLWEIVTLGGTPYIGVPSSELLEFLKSGNRLACPSNCSPDLYAIMQSCWRASPKNRPTFTEICASLEDLLENVSQYLHIENIDHPLHQNIENTDHPLHQSAKKSSLNQLAQNSCSSERYVKPINTLLMSINS